MLSSGPHANIFTKPTFTYPYRDIKFPGQHSDELILFVTREGRAMFFVRLTFISAVIIALAAARAILSPVISRYLPQLEFYFDSISWLLIALVALIAVWWAYTLWKRSVFIITTRRLTKFIYTTPWNRYQLSLGLDKIVDTGAYQKGYFQALAGLGYFVARSAAGNIKNFKIINISFAEDLHNYVNKLLYVFSTKNDQIDRFRPFIPHLKGEERAMYVAQVTPEYQSE